MATDITEFRKRNRLLPCEARGCSNRRWSSSIYCAGHARRSNLYGSPYGQVIEVRTLKPYLKAAQDFLKMHAGAPQIVAALKLLQAFIDRGPYDSPQTEKLMPRLRQFQVSAEDVLPKLIATYLLDRSGFCAALDHPETLTFALGRAVLRTVPRAPYIGDNGKPRSHALRAGVVREVGGWVQRVLGHFCVNASNSITAISALRHERVLIASDPFPLTTAQAAEQK
ncbi:MAG TPA: hypothetical protein VEL07_13805 [Planctomycetota bacterium]|nr:hypothetical protein [Planctomycetota bacterium]